MENLTILDEIIAEIDAGIAKFLTIKTLKPALFSFYYLKILLDVITTKILIIRMIITVEKPDELIAFYHAPQKSKGFFPFSEEESVFSYLLELDGWNVPVKINHPVIRNIQSSKSLKISKRTILIKKINSVVKQNRYLFNMGFIFSRFGLGQTITSIICSFLSYTPKPVMVYESGYNWDYSLPKLFKAGIHPVHRLFSSCSPDSVESPEETEIFKEIVWICKNSETIRQYSFVSGIDFSPVIFEKIAAIVSRSAVLCEKEYIWSTLNLEKKQVRVILVSTQAQHLDKAIIQAARDKGITVISWQHGGAGYCYHPVMYYAEFFNSDIHLVFGEGVADSYRKTCDTRGLVRIPHFISIGSSRLDREREEIFNTNKNLPDSRSILYITEKFEFNLYYNSTTFDSAEICDHFWEVHKKVLSFAGNHLIVPFIFKFHPADTEGEPVRSYARTHNLNNVKFVVQEKTIQELIPEAQVIIIDFVSTGVLEGIISDKPVFVYTGMYSIDIHPLTLLKKRAFLYDNFSILLDDLEKFLVIGSSAFAQEHSVDYNNTEFLQSFGTHFNDGCSATRAAAEILKDIFPKRI